MAWSYTEVEEDTEKGDREKGKEIKRREIEWEILQEMTKNK
jgi:hypothetical protein